MWKVSKPGKCRLWKGRTGRVPVLKPCGTSRVPVPCVTGTWYRHSACTKPVPKRVLSTVPRGLFWQKRPVHRSRTHHIPFSYIPTLEAYPYSRDRLYTHDGTCFRWEQVVQPSMPCYACSLLQDRMGILVTGCRSARIRKETTNEMKTVINSTT